MWQQLRNGDDPDGARSRGHGRSVDRYAGGGSIMAAAFRSRRATNVVLPQPVGPATIHVNGCCQRVSMST